MECGREKPFAIDVGERSHRTAIADAQEVEVGGVLAVFGKHGYGIEARTVMMKLPLYPSVLGGKNKIPIAARTSVVAPVRDGGVVTENRIESHIGLVLIAEIFHPRINFFLAGGVPGHFAAEWVGFGLPTAGASAHLAFEILSLRGHAFALEVGENLNEDAALHLAENSEAVGKFGHRNGSFIRVRQIPVPGMVGDESLVVARQAIEYPVGRGNVRIVVGAIHLFRRLLVPTRP